MNCEEKTIKLSTGVSNVVAVISFIESFTKSAGVKDQEIINDIILTIEEWFVNVTKHGFNNGLDGKAIITLSFQDKKTIVILLKDNGAAFNPLNIASPKVPTSIEDTPLGGLGIVLIVSLTDEQSYERKNGQNILTLTKIIK